MAKVRHWSHVLYRFAMTFFRDSWTDLISAVGLIYPAFGVVYSFAIEGFSHPDPHVRRVQGDRNALWCVFVGVHPLVLKLSPGSS